MMSPDLRRLALANGFLRETAPRMVTAPSRPPDMAPQPKPSVEEPARG